MPSPSSDSEPQPTRKQVQRRPSHHPAKSRATTASGSVAWANNGNANESDALRLVFRKYDVDGDGAISFIDLRKALNQRGSQQRLSDVELQQWITQKDRNGQGVVSFADFCAAFGPAAANSCETSQPAAMRDPRPAAGGQANTKPAVSPATRAIRSPADPPRKPTAAINMKRPSARSTAPEGRRLGYAHEREPAMLANP
ncbi:Calmodulin-like myosin-light chain [Globisporangium polare]